MFEIQFSPLVLSLLMGLIASALYILIGFRRYIVSVARRIRTDAARVIPEDQRYYPSASVIVYAGDDAPNLEVLLPQILDQDYPANFEVIVVNDGAIPSIKDVIGRLEQRYSNLYMTFTPLESRSLSRKKLALTLGIKAARFETVVLTMGDSQVPSRRWLRAICRNFTPGNDIVIGYAAPAAPEGTREAWKRLHAFDTVRSAVEYLSWAVAGRPYRGTCYNLAYRRSIFFDNKGFSKSLDLKYGDDDIFINEVSRDDNTAVELSPDSMVLAVENKPAEAFVADKLRYEYTSSRLRKGARLFFSSCSWAWWIMICTGVAASVLSLPSIIPAIISAIVILASSITIMVVWRRTSVALWSRPLLLTIPWFVSFHPLYTLYYKIKGFLKRGANLTWG